MLLRSWLSNFGPSPRKRRTCHDRRQYIEVLEFRAAPGEMGVASIGMFALADAIAPAAPTEESDREPASSSESLFDQTDTAPPDDEQFPETRRPATPPNRIDTPSQDADALETVFADGGLESALLTAQSTANAAPPKPEPLDLPEQPQPRETGGGGGASGHNPEAGSGIGGVAARGGFAGAHESEMGVVNNDDSANSMSSGGGSGFGGGGDGGPLTAVDDEKTIQEDAFPTITLDPLTNDTGGDAQPFIVAVENPGQGRVWFTSNQITFDPDEHQDTSVSFNYTITDGHGHFADGTVNISITAHDDLPLRDYLQTHTFKNTPVTINLLETVHDPEGPLKVVSVDGTSEHNGSFEYNGDGTATYHPYYDAQTGQGFNGDWDSVLYTMREVSGRELDYSQGIYVVSSNPNVNDPTLFEDYDFDDELVLYEGQSLQKDVIARSYDHEQPLTVANMPMVYGDPSHLDVQWEPDGDVTFQAAADFIDDHQPKTFAVAYYPEDGEGDSWYHAPLISVTVLPQPYNEEPIANTDVVYAAPGSTITINPLLNDSDPEGDQPFLTNVSSGGLLATASYTPNQITLEVDDLAAAGGTIQYTIKDGYGGVTIGSIIVNLVEVTGYLVDRQLEDGSWIPEPGQLWTIDTLGWTPTLSSVPPLSVTRVDMMATDWALRYDPAAYSSFTYYNSGLGMAVGNPGTGIWAFKPRVEFAGNSVQSGFVAMLDDPVQDTVSDIYSVVWKGVDPGDGETNLADDNPVDKGDGWRIFPDKNTFDGPDHRQVKFQISVAPVKAGIPVFIKLFDADDPTADTDPIDKDTLQNGDIDTTDNFGNMPDLPSDDPQSPVAVIHTQIIGGAAIAEGIISVAANPGDNYRLVAAPRAEYFDKLKTFAPDAKGRLFRDNNNTRTRQDDEPILDESSPYAPENVKVSPLLTVWRRLNVEVDSMGEPPDIGVVYDDEDGDDPPPTPDDPNSDDVPNPDISAMADAFEDAFIKVIPIADTPTTTYNEGGLDFALQGDLPDANEPGFDTSDELKTYAEDNRQSKESTWFWSVYVLGIYEYGTFTMEKENYDTSRDNDADPAGSEALLGYCFGDGDESSIIPMEILRDVAAEHGGDFGFTEQELVQFTVVHEIGHQFELLHNSPLDHVMASPSSYADLGAMLNNPIRFRDDDLKKIRDEIPFNENNGP